MRRFRSTSSVALRAPAGGRLDAWVAEGPWLRLAGLALLGAVPAGRALLMPRCQSVHTAGMRFGVDVAFITWPGAPGCEVVAVRAAVRPLRVVAPRGLPRGRVAALEAAAGTFAALGIRAGSPLRLAPAPPALGPGSAGRGVTFTE